MISLLTHTPPQSLTDLVRTHFNFQKFQIVYTDIFDVKLTLHEVLISSDGDQ